MRYFGIVFYSSILFESFAKNETPWKCHNMQIIIPNALTGNRTQIYCLEGNNANHYTINALGFNSIV